MSERIRLRSSRARIQLSLFNSPSCVQFWETHLRIKTRQIIVLTFVLGAHFTVTSCSLTKGKKIAEQAADKFHARFNAGQYHEIFSESDEVFQKATGGEASAIAVFEALRRKLGVVKQANQAGWHVNANTAGTLVSLTYEVEYSEGKGTEQFVFLVKGDKAFLFNYNVNSPLLITK